ncbi:MAG TPA: hypothetical protein ENK57_24785 [Polyangiaceae bacterium]|nr:hypothetical protein [Polyangiaceae bacterium]
MSEDYTDSAEGEGAPADGAPPEPQQGGEGMIPEDPAQAAQDAVAAGTAEAQPGAAELGYDPGAFDMPAGEGAAGGDDGGWGDADAAMAAAAASAAQQTAAAQQGEAPAEEPAPTSQAEVQVSAPEPEPEPKPKKKKKRKIDLKSRLSSVRATGSMAARGSSAGVDRKSDPLSFPPPPTSGVPAPKLPGVSAPVLSSPFAPPEPEKKVSAQAQTIKVEVGEEIVQERAKARKKTAIYVAIAAVVTLVIGFILGQTRERGRAGNLAIEGAEALATDVENANKTMSDLSDALRNAVEQLGNDEYPDALVEKLKTTNVDFSAENFQGRSVGGLPAETFNQLLAYTNSVEKLNKQKDTLRNLLGQAKPLVEKYVKEKKKPTVQFAVMFSKADKKDIARLMSVAEPFPVDGDWPEEFKLVTGSGKKKEEIEVKMFDGKIGTPKVALPVDPKTSAQFTDLTLLFKLRKALTDTRQLIDGVESPNPSLQSDGLLRDGKKLIEGLKKVSRAGG